MKINKELIEKSIKYIGNMDLESKVSMYHNNKWELENSRTYNEFIKKLAMCSIIALSMHEKEIGIDCISFEEIIGQEFLENLNNIRIKKLEENEGWNLLSGRIVSEIENILKQTIRL